MNKCSAFGNCYSIAVKSKNYIPFGTFPPAIPASRKLLYNTTLTRHHLNYRQPSAHDKTISIFQQQQQQKSDLSSSFQGQQELIVMNMRSSNEAHIQGTEEDLSSRFLLNKLMAYYL